MSETLDGTLSGEWYRDFAAALGMEFCPEGRRRIPAGYRSLLVDRDGPDCQLCQGPIDFWLASGPWRCTFDHITEKSRGGGDELENLQLAHKYCNEAKSNPAMLQRPSPPPSPPAAAPAPRRKRRRRRRKAGSPAGAGVAGMPDP